MANPLLGGTGTGELPIEAITPLGGTGTGELPIAKPLFGGTGTGELPIEAVGKDSELVASLERSPDGNAGTGETPIAVAAGIHADDELPPGAARRSGDGNHPDRG